MERRDFLVSAGGVYAMAATGAALAQSAGNSLITPQPTPKSGADKNTSDILVETLIEWGATHVFGIVGDGINPIIEALRKRRDRIAYIGVRHEESAAWMASGMAKHPGGSGSVSEPPAPAPCTC